MKSVKKIISLIAVIAVVITSGFSVVAEQGKQSEKTGRFSSDALTYWNIVDESQIVSEVDLGAVCENDGLLKSGSALTFNLSVQKADDYCLAAKYQVIDPMVMDCRYLMTVDGAEKNVSLPVVWADATDIYDTDRYGNDLVPQQISVDKALWNCFEENDSPAKPPIILALSAGVHTFTLKATVQTVKLERIVLIRKNSPVSYKEYNSIKHSQSSIKNTVITIEAEKFSLKSDSFIRGTSINNAAMSPYDSYTKKINVLDENSWDTAGQKILWEFNVRESGYYKLGFSYSQSVSSNKPVYRSVEIDGKAPFSELSSLRFEKTSTQKYQNKIVSLDETPVELWLESGKHTIAMRAELGPFESVYGEIAELMTGLNKLAMDIKQLTAGETDKNRTWNLEGYLPDAIPTLKKYKKQIADIYKQFEELTEEEPVFADSLKYAQKQMEKLLEEPRTLPNKADVLNVGDSSVTKSLGQILNTLLDQALSLDRIYFVSGKTELPKSKVSFFTTAFEWIKRLVYSFVNEYGSYTPGEDTEELQVWINRPVQYVQTLQQIIDADYNRVNGTDIQLSIMPNEQKLILSYASDTAPDVVLGVNYYTPFEFAIRNAAKNLLEYPEFLKTYNKDYNIEALVPISFGDGVYGAVETQDFQVLFYRNDLLENMGLSVPDTWDDVKSMMPILLRNGMNFGFPLASGGSYKSYHQTSPFVYQNGGKFYSTDGFSVAFTDAFTMKGFEEMTEMFTIYGGQSVVANFYNSFRFSEIPIGISGFSTYMQLQTAAPELANRWSIAPCPGTVQEDGSILRYQVANSTACMIFDNTKHSAGAGKFLMWWLSSDVQLRYSYLLKSSYGSEYSWNTANLTAFRQLDYSKEHMEVILEQLSAQKENLRHPANYMVEREVSNLWNNVVVNNKPLVESADSAKINSDREIIRKLHEFGFCDENGNAIKQYTTDIVANLNKKLQETEG